MKHNRIWLTLLLSAVVAALCGCSGIGGLSEENSDLVAEYSAGVLLRFSDQYQYRLITKDQLAAEQQKDSGGGEPAAETPQPTAAAPDVASEGSAGGAEETSEQTVSLNDVFQQSGLDFSFKSGRFCDRYKEKGGAPIVAQAGDVLYVVSFRVKNTSGKAKSVDLRKSGITYLLTLDDSEFQPGINILSNGGLNYLKTKIGKNETEEAVLIFNVAKERKNASSIQLAVENGGKTSLVKIK